jgi:hypothetical protein
MRTIEFTWRFKLTIALFTLVIFFTSCVKEDEVTPDYVGTWISDVPIPTATGYTKGLRDIMTFSENRVVDLIQLPDGTLNQWIDYMNMKGSLSVSGNIMTVTISEIGISTMNAVTGKPTGTIISYKDGSAEFETILSQSDQSKVFVSEYSVSGNQMTIKTDNNNDGDYSDALETTVYTRQ